MLKAVFFDMDGTITRPYLDFKALRRAVGVPQGIPIMAHIESLDAASRKQAENVLAEAEFHAAQQAQLNPGAADLLAALRACGLKVVVITNNHRRAMEHMVQRFQLQLDLLLSREDAPAKPEPDLIHRALDMLGLEPDAACFVGDGRFDQMASEAAGVRYIHLSHDGVPADGAATIAHLCELWEQLGVEPPEPEDGAGSGS